MNPKAYCRPAAAALLLMGAAISLVSASAMAAEADDSFSIKGSHGTTLHAAPVARFDEPWAIELLPDAAMLVTEKGGALWHVGADGTKKRVAGVPKVAYGGQGGLGDIVLDPAFADNHRVYLSHIATSSSGDTRGAVVIRARLVADDNGWRLTDRRELWRQQPFVAGTRHFSHRLAIGPSGSDQAGYLFITSGERQKQTPAQAMDTNLGKIVRLKTDGSIPANNPFVAQGGVARQIWSLGHRNLLGIAFDPQGQLWAQEMGPRHGDELNRIRRGANYGWPVVSEGRHYSGQKIPAHATRPEFQAPAVAWVPAISPAGLAFYEGDHFSGWQGNALLGGLSSRSLVRVRFDDDTAHEAERYGWGKRVRDVAVADDGTLWLLEDGDGRLLHLTPASS